MDRLHRRDEMRWCWFGELCQATTYPIVIKGRRIMFLALAKAQRALIFVEDIRWKFSAFSDAAVIVAQHICGLLVVGFLHVQTFSSVTQRVIKYNVFKSFSLPISYFISPPEKSQAVSQIYSLPEPFSNCLVFPHPGRAGEKMFNGKSLKNV